jgi:hypothetical protein
MNKIRYNICNNILEGCSTEKEIDICTKFGFDKPQYILPSKKRIIAIGDLHGDLLLTKKSLLLAKVIDEDDNWIAEPDTVVVQVGDQLDSWRPSPTDDHHQTGGSTFTDIDVIYYLNDLHKKAKNKDINSGIYSLLGNHEIMNVYGDMRYVSKHDIIDFDKQNKMNIKQTKDRREHCFEPGNPCAVILACTRHTAMVIGSNLFVHAGILPIIGKKYGIQDINILVKKWLLGELEDSNKNLHEILKDWEISPFWQRILGSLPKDLSIESSDECIKYLDPVLNIYNIKNMIIGHTPQFYVNKSGINSTCSDRLWRIDIGASNAFDKFSKKKNMKHREVQVLEILNDTTFNILR